MKKILFGVVTCVIGLAMANEVSAQPVAVKRTTVVVGSRGHRGHDHYPRSRYDHRSYYRDHGVRFNGGTYFAGRQHTHWGHRVWDSRYDRYQYWEPTLRVYYYYDPIRVGYYPCH